MKVTPLHTAVFKPERVENLNAAMELMIASAYQVQSWRKEREHASDGMVYLPLSIRLGPITADYGEAFGVVRALEALGVGYLGACNVEDGFNLRPWFDSIVKRLEEEGNLIGPDALMDKYRKKYYEATKDFTSYSTMLGKVPIIDFSNVNKRMIND